MVPCRRHRPSTRAPPSRPSRVPIWPLRWRLSSWPRASKLIDHQQAVQDFTRWGLPAAVPSIAVGLFKIGAAALLVAGVATRAVAVALAVEMMLALIVAGPVDGGVQLVRRAAVLCLGLAWASRSNERERTR